MKVGAFTIENMDIIPFGQRLKELRLEKGWTYSQLAFRAGLVRGYIKLVEDGKRFPKPATIEKLSNAFRMSYGDIVSGTDADRNDGAALAVGTTPIEDIDIPAIVAERLDPLIARLFLTAFRRLPEEEQVDIIAAMLRQVENPPTELRPEDEEDDQVNRASGT